MPIIAFLIVSLITHNAQEWSLGNHLPKYLAKIALLQLPTKCTWLELLKKVLGKKTPVVGIIPVGFKKNSFSFQFLTKHSSDLKVSLNVYWTWELLISEMIPNLIIIFI